MAEIKLDCQGLDCPQPVMQTRQAIEQSNPGRIVVLVDNEAAKENVLRYLGTQGYAGSAGQDQAGIWTVSADRTAEAGAKEICQQCGLMSEEELAAVASGICVFITTETIGRGDDELGAKLMANFIATLPELGSSLWRVILLNGAVKLAAKNGPALDGLKKLEQSGVSILVCGTCLDFFKLLEDKQVGETTNMMDVVTSLQAASKIIRP